jgi:hypothetical protein
MTQEENQNSYLSVRPSEWKPNEVSRKNEAGEEEKVHDCIGPSSCGLFRSMVSGSVPSGFRSPTEWEKGGNWAKQHGVLFFFFLNDN